MNTTDIMKNPAFTPILFSIERHIIDAVRAATTAGIDHNDSQIRSTLNKVRKTSEGGAPKNPDETPRDRILADLHFGVLEIPKSLPLRMKMANANPYPPNSGPSASAPSRNPSRAIPPAPAPKATSNSSKPSLPWPITGTLNALFAIANLQVKPRTHLIDLR